DGIRALIVTGVQTCALPILDRWCRYDPSLSEPSRETGIPRTAVVSAEVTAGAAGTIASNLSALGAGRVAVLGVIGDDGNGEELRSEERRVGEGGCVWGLWRT